MDSFEKLAIAQAIYKAVADQVATKDPYNLRGECDEYMRQRYEESGEKLTKRIVINGCEVGTLFTNESKPVASSVETTIVVEDIDALGEWATSHVADEFDRFLDEIKDETMERFARWYAARTGELPEGCTLETVVIPARPRSYCGTVLKVDERAVANALEGQLPAYVANLLEGETEDEHDL